MANYIIECVVYPRKKVVSPIEGGLVMRSGYDEKPLGEKMYVRAIKNSELLLNLRAFAMKFESMNDAQLVAKAHTREYEEARLECQVIEDIEY